MLTKLLTLGSYLSLIPCILFFTNGLVQNTLLYLHALGLLRVVYFLIDYELPANEEVAKTRKKEMYGLRHLIFNIDFQPKTLWFNMGLWNTDISYAEACENLVHAVVSNFNIKPNSTMLDVGFGCGDSSILLAEKYHAKVTGITNEYSQWDIASKRVSKLELKDSISLLHGSAEQLNDLVSNSMYDYIISIDSAYHYNTRWDFLKNAYNHLKRQGMIGLYDIAIDSKLKKSSEYNKMLSKACCSLLRIPLRNLVTVEQYQKNMEALGYKNVQIQTIDKKRVFGGLSQYFEKQYKNAVKNGIGISFTNRIILKGASYLFGALVHTPWIVPVIVEGRKK